MTSFETIRLEIEMSEEAVADTKTWSRNHKFKGEDTMFVKILMPVKLWDSLKEIAEDNERQYSDQVRFFLKKAIQNHYQTRGHKVSGHPEDNS